MLIRSNPHTHTTFCDGKNTAAEVAASAVALGFVSLGFSGHAPQKADHGFGIQNEKEYIREILRLQKQYEGKMNIWNGIECDLYGECDLSEYEYVIGSVHYLKLGGEDYGVDGDRDRLDSAYERFFHEDGLEMVRLYYKNVVQCAKKLRPDILGHFDLIRKHNGDAAKRYFDTTDPAYRKIALTALEEVLESGALLEVNTGGMARGYLATPYPDRFILEAWHEMGGEVIVSSDCHEAKKLEYGFEDAVCLLRNTGFRSVCRLGADKRLFEEIELAR